MHGRGLICLRLQNHSFFEHRSLVQARAEAGRLAQQLQSEVVVYVPVLSVRPTPPVVEEPITVAPTTVADALGRDDDHLF